MTGQPSHKLLAARRTPPPLNTTVLTGVERTFAPHEIIVSKTDPKGRITYCNQVFVRISGYAESELLGAPHNLIRHPHMPRGVFRLLWDTLEAGREIFAYVVNRSKNGDHYWVFAHVTPTLDAQGRTIGYHSNRRSPDRVAVKQVKAIYDQMLEIERGFRSPKEACQASLAWLTDVLEKQGVGYDEFVFTLARGNERRAALV